MTKWAGAISTLIPWLCISASLVFGYNFMFIIVLMMTRVFPLFRAKLITGKLGSHELSNILPPWVSQPLAYKWNLAQLSLSLFKPFIPKNMRSCVAWCGVVGCGPDWIEYAISENLSRMHRVRQLYSNFMHAHCTFKEKCQKICSTFTIKSANPRLKKL